MITVAKGDDGEIEIWLDPEEGPQTGVCLGSDPDYKTAFARAELALAEARFQLTTSELDNFQTFKEAK